MSIYDNFNNGNQTSQTIVLNKLPESLEEMRSMPEAAMDTPYKTAALTVCALCAYAINKNIGREMLDFLRGPRPLSNIDISFLDDRFRDGQIYVPFSYFKGSVPENDYAPDYPFALNFFKDAYSDANAGYMRLNIKSGGADSPRQITLRQRASDGVWFLYEQAILVGIRKPKSQDPWG